MLPKRSGAAGKLLLAPGSRSGGGSSSTPAAAAPAAPAQFEIQVVRMSAHASVLASQQLWPPATFATILESRGDDRVTIPFAAA